MSKKGTPKLKIMKRALLFSISLLFIIMSSCTKPGEPLIMSPIEKLQGEWFYNKAFFVYNNGLIRDDVLSDFIDARVRINGNQMTMEDLRTGQILEGSFQLYKDDLGGYWDENGNYVEDIERFLTAYLYDTQTNREVIIDWQINYLTRNKFNVGEFYQDGNYSFKMKKID